MEKISHIFDSHAHYDDPRFAEDRDELLSSMPDRGVERIINAGSDLASSRFGLELAGRYPFVYCAAGIHPQSVLKTSEADWEALKRLFDDPKVRAVGEIGLDYYYEPVDRERQQFWLERQLRFAAERELPVIIHDRDAHADTLTILKKYRPQGVVHCFSGSAEMVREVVKLGMYLGYTGVVTFKNARRALEAVRETPLERLLIETDCPYLAPEPCRGRRCDSSLLIYTAAKLAEIKGVAVQELVDRSFENASRLYGIS